MREIKAEVRFGHPPAKPKAEPEKLSPEPETLTYKPPLDYGDMETEDDPDAQEDRQGT